METALDNTPNLPPTAGQQGPDKSEVEKTGFRVLGAISFSHFLNDMIQSLLLAIYPLLKGNFNLSFAQIGLITLTFQVTASLLQPLVGLYTDKHPKPYSLAIGMGSTLCGLLLLSVAPNFTVLLIAAALVGTGSSVFHPEASRVARMASGGRHGLAQSLFQVGGNAGSAMGPLLAAWIIIPGGRQHCLVHDCRVAGHRGVAPDRSLVSASAIAGQTKPKKKSASYVPLPRKTVIKAVSVLLILIFSKYFYMASLSSYFTFYLISKFNLSVQDAQIHLFIFLFAVAVGTSPVVRLVTVSAASW